MDEHLEAEQTKLRVAELLKASRRVVTLERRRGRLVKQLEDVNQELRTAKRLLRDVAGDQLPGVGDPRLNQGELP